MDFIWSNTDYPYLCLKDKKRTLAFKRTIERVVKPNDIVVDAGSGSGILSFFAAAAGAKKVYAVEIEHVLAEQISQSAIANKLSEVVEVVEGDIRKVDLPQNVDVVIAELIDTGLIDEMQCPAINSLRERGVIGSSTIVIPGNYKTYLDLIYTDHRYYGFNILAPKHEWPYYSGNSKPFTNLFTSNSEWEQTKIISASDKIEVVNADFNFQKVDENVDKVLEFKLNRYKKANGLRISGVISLLDGFAVGAMNSLNGDKILSIPPVINQTNIKIRVQYKMGIGMRSFHLDFL